MKILSRFNTEQGARILLDLTKEEIEMLKLGKEAIQHFIRQYGLYTNDQIEVVYNLIDKISDEAT